MNCSNCGNSIREGAAFCDQCGVPVNEDREAQEYHEYNVQEPQQVPQYNNKEYDRQPQDSKNETDIVSLISAFAFVGLIIGIIITATAESDVGYITVIISAVVIAVCQIITWIGRKIRKE